MRSATLSPSLKTVSGNRCQAPRHSRSQGHNNSAPPQFVQPIGPISHHLDALCPIFSAGDAIREDAWLHGTDPVIPTKINLKVQRPVDPLLYALRNRIERFFNRLKNARRVATRYDKTADSFLAFVQLASIKIWLRFVNRA
jgi:transposase